MRLVRKQWTRFCGRERGVTLAELLVTITVLGILLAVGIPAMARFMNDIRVSNTTNEFVNALSLARSEAIRRGRLVSVCQSSTPDAATPGCDEGTSWASGWIVFVETSAGADHAVTAANVLSRRGQLSSNVNAESNLGVVTFNSLGEPVGAAAFGVNMNFNYDGEMNRQVCMGRSGRVRVEKDVACN